MDADFDLGKLQEIPDVVPPAARDERPVAPRMAPRVELEAPGPSRSEVRGRRVLALGAALAWFGAQVGVLGLRMDFARLGTSYPLAQIALPAALGAVALGAALWSGGDGLGAPVRWLRTVTIGGLAGMTAVALFWPLPFDYVPPPTYGFAQWILLCADIVAIMGAVPLALSALVLRRAFAAGAFDRSAAIGAACGLGAVTAMHLHCENLQPAHLALGHMVPAMGLAAAGALFLQRSSRA